VAQQILDAFHLGIGIEQLGGHGMAQMMAADLQPGLFGVMGTVMKK
jgi:hypothetical protein